MQSYRVAVLFLIITALLSHAADKPAFEIEETQKRIVELTNQERKQEGLKPLKRKSKLDQISRKHSGNMAKQKDLSHRLDGKTISDKAKEADYDYGAIGENIAFNQQSAEEVVKSWMESPGHRANILNPDFTEIGVGIVFDDENQPYFTQYFGRAASDGPTNKAVIKVINKTGKNFDVGFEGKPAELIEPNVTAKFTVSAVGDLPKLKVKSGEFSREFAVKDGESYSINEENSTIEVRAGRKPVP